MSNHEILGGAGSSRMHDSARLHVTGEADYVDDLPVPALTLYAAFGVSQYANARVTTLDLERVRQSPGVASVVTAHDIPGENLISFIQADEPVFASTHVECVGQPLFAVAAQSFQQARAAIDCARVEYEPLVSVLTVEQALADDSFILPSKRLSRGNATHALESATHHLEGQLQVGGQEHFYFESQVSLAIPNDNGGICIHSATQYPSHIQQAVARVLGLKRISDVTVMCRRIGGAFGGKETQSTLFACVAALLAAKTGQAVKCRLTRQEDMVMTGKRHDFIALYQVGFDDEGRIEGYRVELSSRCGMSADLSGFINDRAMLHSDNCYFLPHVTINSHRCKTNTVSNTAFRGFGAPQAIWVMEQIIDEIARYLGQDPLDIRKRNFYEPGRRSTTPYGMRVEDPLLHEIVSRLETDARYRERRAEIEDFNRHSPILKRGLALTPVKYGVAFTQTHLNQAGALVHLYIDGSVYLNHGGTEMGQGLYTKVAQVVAEELQIDMGRITISAADTSKVPNASATAASVGSDLNGKAAQAAARTIKLRLVEFAAKHFNIRPEEVVFSNNRVSIGSQQISFQELVALAYHERISLSATGFYRTPEIEFDRSKFTGRPFLYFSYGAAVSEVAIDTLTGENTLLKVDILHDCGRSLNPAIDRGQIEGAFLQGAGWLTMEELIWNDAGVLQTNTSSSYKIPACRDCPVHFNVELLETTPNRKDTVFSSKAVGEPPFMLAISVFQAIKDAIAAAGNRCRRPQLDAPATPERILNAIQDIHST
ncbi:MAG TPA: xanthine dehydrogenase molybdopterin binding subunit [Nitrospirales bacterium]|nr:xanthine dehydrogenase molybdopterin binding subunit [Nitrospiraceae bacterium]HNP31376.1 xanthine dehydrogenase molybdopterin binding subunit [Nitrospirales bacterium]